MLLPIIDVALTRCAKSPDFEQHYLLLHIKKKVLGLFVLQSRETIAEQCASNEHYAERLIKN